MNADIKWLDNPEVFRVNQLAAHSDHEYYTSYIDLEENNNYLTQSLNGTWKFCYSKNAKVRPVNFYKQQLYTMKWDEIAVPGHIELAGYDKIRYINTMYPWEGKNYRRPAYSIAGAGTGEGMFSEAEYNPVGSYIKEFDLDRELRGKRITICFEGVEQAMYVWLNGEFVGYAEDSFTPSEFDLTPYIKERGNILAVEVHKMSTAAFLEDQDFFRFFGIFRNVSLKAKPDVHVEDLWIKPFLNTDNVSGRIVVDIKASSIEDRCFFANVILKDEEKQVVLEKKAPFVKPRDVAEIRLVSGDSEEIIVDITNLEIKEEEMGTTLALIKGVVAGFKNHGYNIGGFCAYVTSDVLIGSGMSSSAAFETLVGTILSGLYNEMKIHSTDIAIIGQYAENVYFGKPCGLMDQMACSTGSLVHIDFKNPKEPVVERVAFDLGSYGYSLCITDTKGSHADLTDEYAAVPEEMKRVEKEVDALKEGNLAAFFETVKASGDSSYKYLQNVYSVKDVHQQNVSLALAVSEAVLAGNGVCRVHGGGFAGTIQAFVKNEDVKAYQDCMDQIFGDGACGVLNIRKYGGIQVV